MGSRISTAAIVHDLRVRFREASGKALSPVVISDYGGWSRGATGHARVDSDSNKRRKDNKVHLAVDTLGSLLSLVVIPANAKNERIHENLFSPEYLSYVR